MNLKRLFEIQKQLDDRIVEQHGLQDEDLLPQKILALQVELGECAQEWRGFKFWSKNQNPVTYAPCFNCDETGVVEGFVRDPMIEKTTVNCRECNGTGNGGNPLLEEYVDCLHFILSVGLEMDCKGEYQVDGDSLDRTLELGIAKTFTTVMSSANVFLFDRVFSDRIYAQTIKQFLVLGQMLGFSEDTIEQAYLDKNNVNHERQASGY